MHAKQIPSDPVDILEHDCSLDFDRKNSTALSYTPLFYSGAAKVYQQFERGLDEQQHARARDRNSYLARTKRAKADDPSDEAQDHADLKYVRTGGSINVPEIEVFGDFSNTIYKMLPKTVRNNANDKTPAGVHRFIIVPLEDAMDQ